MAIKKNYRADNTYIISTDSTDNPKLGAKVLSDGRESLFLDYYFGFSMAISGKTGKEYKKVDSKREYMSLYLWQAPRTPIERQQNKETLELAKKIRFERGQQLLELGEGYRLKKKQEEVDLLDYMKSYYEAYNKTDVREIYMAYRAFVDYLSDPNMELIPETIKGTMTKEQKAEVRKENELKEQQRTKKIQKLRFKPNKLTREVIVGFTDYLQDRYNGESPHAIYARFKKIIKNAVEKDIVRKNPTTGISIKIDRDALKKEVLSEEEIIRLISTHYPQQNPEIRRAFILSLYCGIRWCDVKELTYDNVDFSNRLLTFEQAKTKGHSSASTVIIPLNDGLLNLIGEPTDGDRQQKLFNLPSHTMCLKALRNWTKKANIKKHITWHCARHTFGTMLVSKGHNIKTVSSLMGHSSLQMTEKYVRAVDSLKQQAIDSLPELKF